MPNDTVEDALTIQQILIIIVTAIYSNSLKELESLARKEQNVR